MEGMMAEKKTTKTGPKNSHAASSKPGRTDSGSTAAREAPNQAPPGLDNARHAAAQKRAHQADVLHKGAFAALVAAALSIDPFFETGAYRLYLERILDEAGNPTDPIEAMLVQQLCLAHFRIGKLHVGAEMANGVEAMKLYSAAAARMLGEFRRTALALHVYRAHIPEGKDKKKLRVFKIAQ
jgi:hypothetical protein